MCQSYWSSMKSSMFIIMDCYYGNNGWLAMDVTLQSSKSFSEMNKDTYCSWTMYKRDIRQTHSLAQTHTHTTKTKTHTNIRQSSQQSNVLNAHTSNYTINRQHYRSPLTIACFSDTGRIIPFLQ